MLERDYFRIVAEFEQLNLRDYGIDTYMAELGMISTRSLRTPEEITRKLWL